MADDQTTAPAAAAAAALQDADGGETVRERAVREADEMAAQTPTPTQEELDQKKLGVLGDGGKAGSYKTRQAKAN